MKRLLLLAALVMVQSPAPAADSSAPYFQILGSRDEQAPEQLPLKSSLARVAVDGTIARVRLTQRYANTGNVPIEALYVFPASTRAAVHGMTLTTGGRVIAARIRESVKARAEYETAKQQHKTAALLEEHRPNVFQMSVANLLPGDDVTVEVEWTETIPEVDATYEYVLPTVVGPRYTGGGSHSAGETWTANPHLTEGAPAPATLGIEVVLNTALPLAEVTCPSHPGLVDFKARDRAEVKLDTRAGEDAANRDFILRWKLGGDRVDAGLLLHQDESGGHFLLQVEPPRQVTPDQVPPRDYVMVVDVSGSMTGFPLDTAKALLKDLVLGLKPTDTFNVMYFASGSELFAERPQTATREHLEQAVRFLEKQPAGGGTELKAALRRALALPDGEDRSRSIILVTDGYVSGDQAVRDLVRENIGRANLFAFGIGSSVNRELIESVARAGGGEPAVVTSPGEAAAAARRFLTSISSPVLAKVRIAAEGFQVEQTAPSPCPDVFASRALIITGRWQGEPQGALIVRGIAGNGEPFEKRIEVARAAAEQGLSHPALPVLWARERVRELGDQGPATPATVREITGLGLRYSLLTAYTSFVAVDETPKELARQALPVKQPLPLPQGVSAAAVGGSQPSPLVHNGSVPEPGALGLLSLLALLLAVQRRR